jgi:hypothetical protein
MEMKESTFTAQFSQMPTSRIEKGLQNNLWEGEKREAAVALLKRRGKDIVATLESISEYSAGRLDESLSPEDTITDLPPTSDPLTFEQVRELDKAISWTKNFGSDALVSKVIELIGDKSCKEASFGEAEAVLSWVLEEKKKNLKAEQEDRKFKPISRKRIVVELSEEKKLIAKKILEKPISKKEKVANLAEKEFTRSEVLSLKFADTTYIYDMFREMYPSLCK